MKLFCIVFVVGISGCGFFSDEEGRELVPFQNDLHVWVAEESLPYGENPPEFYVSFQPIQYFSPGNDAIAEFYQDGNNLYLLIHGRLTPEHGSGSIPEDIRNLNMNFRANIHNGDFNLFVYYQDKIDRYEVNVTDDNISIVSVDTSFTKPYFSSFKRYEEDTFACRFTTYFVNENSIVFFQTYLDSIRQVDGIHEIDCSEEAAALTFRFEHDFGGYWTCLDDDLNAYFRYTNAEELQEVKVITNRFNSENGLSFHRMEVIDWSNLVTNIVLFPVWPYPLQKVCRTVPHGRRPLGRGGLLLRPASSCVH